MLQTLRFIGTHPLCRAHRVDALLRFARWQVANRVFPAGYVVDFAEDARLLVRRGMAGATGNIYTGLHEFEEMGFAAHCLREGDLFIDAGANVGAYTVLAAKARGARVISIEPVPSTFAALAENIRLNQLESRVEAMPCGVSEHRGVLRFSAGGDTTNHVVESGGVEVPVETIDALVRGRAPVLMKVDVEGFEVPLLRGAALTLNNPALRAVIIETNGSGAAYGFSDADIHSVFTANRFTPCRYDPLTRRLEVQNGPRENANTIYVRDPGDLQKTLAHAKPLRVHGQSV